MTCTEIKIEFISHNWGKQAEILKELSGTVSVKVKTLEPNKEILFYSFRAESGN